MPREIPLLSESKKQALKKMSKEEWDVAFNAYKGKVGAFVADNVIAMMILSEVEGKISSGTQKSSKTLGFVRLDTLNGAQPDTHISVPLWLYNRKQFTGKVKGQEVLKNGYTGIDGDYKTISVFEVRPTLSNFQDGQKVYLNNVKVFAKPSGEISLSVWERGDMKEIVEAFKQPPPVSLKKLNELDGYYCCIEAIGLPGSFKQTDYGTVRFEVVDHTNRSVKLVVYKDVVSKLLKEGKINVELENLDRCKLRVFGVYKEKLVRPNYTEVDFITVWGIEILEEIAYPTFTKPLEARSEEKPPEEDKSTEEEGKSFEESLNAIVSKVQKALEKEMLDGEFIELFGDDNYKQLQELGVIEVNDGIVGLVKPKISKKQLKKEEAYFDEHNGEEPTNLPDEVTDDELELCGVLRGLDKELEKLGNMKGVEIGALQEALKWEDRKLKESIEKLMAKGELYEPIDGRYKK